MTLFRAALALAAGVLALHTTAPAAQPVARGLTAARLITDAYDAILGADFAGLPSKAAAACGPAPPAVCRVIEAAGLWWQINMDPTSRALDGRFITAADAAIAATEAWTLREPQRAEAWFYHGAAYGARLQFKALREERLSAARDGKRIKDALERALALDPALDDAQFGIGMYRYYADVAPAALKFLRWLLLLPGGNRAEGLAQMQRTAERGQVSRWEAAYQLHLVYLWYEKRFTDALDIVTTLQARFPRNPHFWQLEAEIRDVYFSDARGSLRVSEALEARVADNAMQAPALARTVAKLNIAKQLTTLGERGRARVMLEQLIAEQPAAPANAMLRARAMLRAIER